MLVRSNSIFFLGVSRGWFLEAQLGLSLALHGFPSTRTQRQTEREKMDSINYCSMYWVPDVLTGEVMRQFSVVPKAAETTPGFQSRTSWRISFPPKEEKLEGSPVKFWSLSVTLSNIPSLCGVSSRGQLSYSKFMVRTLQQLHFTDEFRWLFPETMFSE